MDLNYCQKLQSLKDSHHFAVTLTYAQSLDGSIAVDKNSETKISCLETLKLTHYIRSINDCILVGIGTILADNPSLTTRFIEGKTPKPVILDSNLRIPLDSRILVNPECAHPILFCSKDAFHNQTDKVNQLINLGAEVEYVNLDESSHLKFDEIFDKLSKSYTSIMIEGGSEVITNLLNKYSHLIDIILITISPQFIGGYRCINRLLSKSIEVKNNKTMVVGNDIVIMGYLNN